MVRRTFYERVIKRILDVLLSGIAMLLFSWLYAILALLVRVFLGRPVIFSQERPGRNDLKSGKEKPFRLYKFRSMKNLKDRDGKDLPDDARLTKFGRVLRSTSLDELPEAWNIFKGDMSVVGPRPLLMEYLPYYTEREHHRHDVRPGLTGLAQVNGRTAVTWQKKSSSSIWAASSVRRIRSPAASGCSSRITALASSKDEFRSVKRIVAIPST